MSRSKLPAVFIGLRYLLAKRDNRFISFTSLVSMAGLTLGVLALVVVLSVFNGSQGVMRDRTLITVPHADISATPAFTTWQAAVELLQQQAGIEAVAPYTRIEALISEKGYHQVTEVRGILPTAETRTSPLPQSIVAGSVDELQPGRQGIVLGSGLANTLRVWTGDTINLVVPHSNAAGNRVDVDMHRFTVVGIFDVQFNIGSDLAYVHLQDSEAMLGDASLESALHLRLKTSDIDRADEQVTRALATLNRELPGPAYQGEDWSVSEATLFNALRLEKFMTWLMLMMIVAIGAFNIISTLVMVVAEKQADIAILRTMGAGQGTILAIFLVQGSTVGVLGISLGAIAGSIIARHFTPIAAALENVLAPDSVYLISALPSRWQGSDVIVTCSVALLISFIATLYPAWKASRIHPAQVLRYV
jgi:lipoprotein-releasing system permease protein